MILVVLAISTFLFFSLTSHRELSENSELLSLPQVLALTCQREVLGYMSTSHPPAIILGHVFVLKVSGRFYFCSWQCGPHSLFLTFLVFICRKRWEEKIYPPPHFFITAVLWQIFEQKAPKMKISEQKAPKMTENWHMRATHFSSNPFPAANQPLVSKWTNNGHLPHHASKAL